MSLRSEQWYRLERTDTPQELWQVVIVGYNHTLYGDDEREIVAYHWHPQGPSDVVIPHLHLGAGALRLDLTKAHLPTGPVPLPAVLRLAIRDLGVRPLRADWDMVLARVQADLRAD